MRGEKMCAEYRLAPTTVGQVFRTVRLCKNPFVYSGYSWVSDHTSAKSVSQRLKISFLVAINTSRARVGGVKNQSSSPMLR
jgi:hypothetical protein